MEAGIAATTIKIAVFGHEEGLRLARGLLLALDFEVGSDILKNYLVHTKAVGWSGVVPSM